MAEKPSVWDYLWCVGDKSCTTVTDWSGIELLNSNWMYWWWTFGSPGLCPARRTGLCLMMTRSLMAYCLLLSDEYLTATSLRNITKVFLKDVTSYSLCLVSLALHDNITSVVLAVYRIPRRNRNSSFNNMNYILFICFKNRGKQIITAHFPLVSHTVSCNLCCSVSAVSDISLFLDIGKSIQSRFFIFVWQKIVLPDNCIF